MIVFSTKGLSIVIEALVQKELQLQLFQSDSDLNRNTTLESLRLCDFPGYAPVALLAGDWVIEEEDDGEHMRAVHDEVEFTRSKTGDPQRVFGYCVTSEGRYVYGERMDDRLYIVKNKGDAIKVPPMLQSKSVE